MAVTRENIGKVREATGKSFEAWVTWLDSIGARGMPHKEIAERIGKTGEASMWWAQTITVAYEQEIGRRVPGQNCDGDFSVSVNKTFWRSSHDVFAAWVEFNADLDRVDGVSVVDEPNVTETEKWYYWRVRLSDGSQVTAGMNKTSGEKCQLGIGHEKLNTERMIEPARAFWKQRIAQFGDVLSPDGK